MRGEDQKQEAMFSYVSPEKRVPEDHPLRGIREMVDTILKEMSPRFARLYAEVGRPSIAPERLLEARLYKKSKGSEAKLSYLGHALMENRNGLLVKTLVTEAKGTAERDAALLMAEKIPGVKRVTLGGDKNYDTKDFVRELRRMKIVPHVAQNNQKRASAIDERTTRHVGYEVSQRKRKRIEESFGWMKIIGLLKKVKLRGLEKVGWLFTFVGAAYNLYRLQKLKAEAMA